VRPAVTVASMGKKQTITIRCELEPDGDSLSGFASRDDGGVYEFTGWLGLIGVLQALLLADVDPASASARAADPTPTARAEGNIS
jgi:hypothetical protein